MIVERLLFETVSVQLFMFNFGGVFQQRKSIRGMPFQLKAKLDVRPKEETLPKVWQWVGCVISFLVFFFGREI